MTVPLKHRLSARLAFSALVRCIAVALSAMVAAPAVGASPDATSSSCALTRTRIRHALPRRRPGW